MSAIQVKGVPVELHERLRARARAEGRSLSDYVLDVLERDLAVPTTREWLAQVKRAKPVRGISRELILESIRQERDQRDERIRAAIARH